jgi:hypothetical protein
MEGCKDSVRRGCHSIKATPYEPAWYARPLAGLVKEQGTAAPSMHSTLRLQYTVPNSHIVGTWLHQEHEGNESPV